MSVQLRWTDNSDNEDGFRVYRKTDDGEAESLMDLPADTTQFKDDSVEEAHTYVYTVTAFNRAGESAPSNEFSIEVPLSVTIPTAPSDLTGELVANP